MVQEQWHQTLPSHWWVFLLCHTLGYRMERCAHVPALRLSFYKTASAPVWHPMLHPHNFIQYQLLLKAWTLAYEFGNEDPDIWTLEAHIQTIANTNKHTIHIKINFIKHFPLLETWLARLQWQAIIPHWKPGTYFEYLTGARHSASTLPCIISQNFTRAFQSIPIPILRWSYWVHKSSITSKSQHKLWVM